MAPMKASTEKNDTSEALSLPEHPNHKSKPIVVSDMIQINQRRETIDNISSLSIRKCEDHTRG